MIVKYSKKRLFSNLILGALFALFGVVKTIDGTADYFNYFQLLLGTAMMVGSYFDRHMGYLKMKDGFLKKNSLRRKTIKLADVIQIQSLPGKIKLLTSDKNLSINTGIIDEESLKDLYCLLGSLEIDSQENPFIGWSQTKS